MRVGGSGRGGGWSEGRRSPGSDPRSFTERGLRPRVADPIVHWAEGWLH